jgi:hypothetical protein
VSATILPYAAREYTQGIPSDVSFVVSLPSVVGAVHIYILGNAPQVAKYLQLRFLVYPLGLVFVRRCLFTIIIINLFHLPESSRLDFIREQEILWLTLRQVPTSLAGSL